MGDIKAVSIRVRVLARHTAARWLRGDGARRVVDELIARFAEESRKKGCHLHSLPQPLIKAKNGDGETKDQKRAGNEKDKVLTSDISKASSDPFPPSPTVSSASKPP